MIINSSKETKTFNKKFKLLIKNKLLNNYMLKKKKIIKIIKVKNLKIY